MEGRVYQMPPSLHAALRAKAAELGYKASMLARLYFMRGLTDAGEPPGEWWYKVEPVEPDIDDKISIELRLALPIFGKVVEFQRRDGFQTRALAIEQLLRLGLSVADNRGSGLGGRY